MRKMLILGGWYAMLFAALLLAEPRRVSSSEAPLRSGPSDYTDKIGTATANDILESTGKTEEGFVEVKLRDGKIAWIASSDLFSLKQEETLKDTSTTGGGAGEQAEGAYVKGFDPEVEGKMREDNPGLDRIYQEEIFPWVWEVRGGGPEGRAVSQELEMAEEAQEKLMIQGQPEEAAKLQSKIDDLRRKVQPYRDAWQAKLRAWRQAGQIGEFARKK